MKRTERIKFFDYFGLFIEANPSKVGKKNVCFIRIWSIPSTSSGNPHIESQQLDKQFNLEPPKLQLYQLTKNISDKIVSRIYSALRDLSVIFDKYILSRSTVLEGADRAGTEDS